MAPRPMRDASTVKAIFGEQRSITRKPVETEMTHHSNSTNAVSKRRHVHNEIPYERCANSLTHSKCLYYKGPNSTPGKVDAKVPISVATSWIENY